MQVAVAFVEANPGASSSSVIAHVLDCLQGACPRSGPKSAAEVFFRPPEDERRRLRRYKQAAGVVERIICKRLVRQDAALRLHPWDEKRRAYAEALERAAILAPDDARRRSTLTLAIEAWRDAGDENRAQALERVNAP